MSYKGPIVEGPRPPRCPKRRKPPRAVQNSISGRGATPEYDLVPMDLEGPECGKNSLPLDFATECSAA